MKVVYKMTLLTNGKIYIGQHSDSSDNYDAFYKECWGGGVIWKNYLKCLKKQYPKTWKEYIKKEILWSSKNCSQRTLSLMEVHFIKLYNSYWNFGKGAGCNLLDAVENYVHAPETRRKISKKKKGQKQTPEAIEKIRKGNTGLKRTPEQRKRYSKAQKKRFENSPAGFEGKHFSDESKQKISKALTGLKRTPEQRKRMSEAKRKLNRRHTDEEKRYQSEKLKEYYRTHQHPCSGIKLSEEHKKKISLSAPHLFGDKNPMYGKVYINNGSVNKIINKSEKLPDGWKYGMAPKNYKHKRYACRKS